MCAGASMDHEQTTKDFGFFFLFESNKILYCLDARD